MRSVIMAVANDPVAMRLFVISQILGILLIVFVDVQSIGWSINPWAGRLKNWLFDSHYWNGHRGIENWFAMLGLFGPAFFAWAVHWIRSAKK